MEVDYDAGDPDVDPCPARCHHLSIRPSPICRMRRKHPAPFRLLGHRFTALVAGQQLVSLGQRSPSETSCPRFSPS